MTATSRNRRRRLEQRRTELGVKVRLKAGRWYVLVAHNGKRRSRYFGADKAGAEAYAEEVRAGIRLAKALRRRPSVEDFVEAGVLAPDEPTAAAAVRTFGTYAALFLERYDPETSDAAEGLKLSTWLDYKSCLEGRLATLLGDRPLASISRADRKALEDRLRHEGLKAANVRKHLRIVSSVLSEAVDEELLAANPFLQPRTTKRRRSRAKAAATVTRINPLSHDEVTHLLQTAYSHAITRGGTVVYPYRAHYPLLLTLARTGLRWGEAIALTWADIDWRGRFLWVRASHVRRRTDVTKSGKNRRVYVSSQLLATLRALYEARTPKVRALDAATEAAREAASSAAAAGALIFSTAEGTHLDNRNFHRDVWQPLLATAGLSGRQIKDLRHTAASLLVERGRLPHYVQEQLGHHAVTFTMERYVHLPSGYGNQADCLDDASLPFAPSAPTLAPSADFRA